MANNNNGSQKGRYNPDQFKPQELADGLIEMPITLNLSSVAFKEKTSVLATKLEDLVGNTLEISEIDHIAIKPKMDRDGSLIAVLCRAYFDTSEATATEIVRKGAGGGVSNSGTKTILGLLGGGGLAGTGDFVISDKFKQTFAPLVANDDGRINVGSIKEDKNVAVLDLDFMSMMTMALGIKSDSPYNFSIMACSPIDGEDFIMLISKYIDTNNRKRGRHKRNRTNYRDLDREWAKQNDAYYGKNGGNRRSF